MYIQQGEDSTCSLIALLNAKRYYGFDTCTYGDDEFERLVDMAACRYGSAIHITEVADYLHLNRITIDQSDLRLPFTFSCFPPDRRLHCVLCIDISPEKWHLVNYWKCGPVMDWVSVSDIDFVAIPLGCEDQDFRKFHHLNNGVVCANSNAGRMVFTIV